MKSLYDIKLKHILIIVESELMKHFMDKVEITRITIPRKFYNDKEDMHEVFEAEFYVGHDSSKTECFQIIWDCNLEMIQDIFDMSEL